MSVRSRIRSRVLSASALVAATTLLLGGLGLQPANALTDPATGVQINFDAPTGTLTITGTANADFVTLKCDSGTTWYRFATSAAEPRPAFQSFKPNGVSALSCAAVLTVTISLAGGNDMLEWSTSSETFGNAVGNFTVDVGPGNDTVQMPREGGTANGTAGTDSLATSSNPIASTTLLVTFGHDEESFYDNSNWSTNRVPAYFDSVIAEGSLGDDQITYNITGIILRQTAGGWSNVNAAQAERVRLLGGPAQPNDAAQASLADGNDRLYWIKGLNETVEIVAGGGSDEIQVDPPTTKVVTHMYQDLDVVSDVHVNCAAVGQQQFGDRVLWYTNDSYLAVEGSELLDLRATGLVAGTSMGCDIEPFNTKGDTRNRGGFFQPKSPKRVFDTRPQSGVYGSSARLTPNQVKEWSLRDSGALGNMEAASGMLVNVTVDSPLAAGYVSLWPSMTPQPDVSTLNFQAGETRANMAIIPTDVSSRISIASNVSTHVIIDVLGYYSTTAQGIVTGFGSTEVIEPIRAFDTRPSSLNADYTSGFVGPLSAGGTMTLDVASGSGVLDKFAHPPITAVVMNLTGVATGTSAFVTTYAAGAPRPTASTLNLGPTSINANMAVIPVSPDGKVSFYANAPVHLVGDIVGYVSADPTPTTRGRYIPDTPTRLIDTRNSSGYQGQSNILSGLTPFAFLITDSEGYVDPLQGPFVGNLTVVPETDTFARIWAADLLQPGTSNINAKAGQPTANAVWGDTAGGYGYVSLNGRGSVIIDYAGYFTAF